MAIGCGARCGKGDILDSIEILVEQSSPDNRVTVTMWKRHDDKFGVAKRRVGGKFEDIVKYDDGKNETEARRVYEDSCDGNGCSPYPEAKEYYKKKGISLP